MRDIEEGFVARIILVDSAGVVAELSERLSKRKVPSVLCLTLIFALGGAHGQDLQGAQGCTRLSEDAARLACYDAALRVAKPATSAARSQASPPPVAGRADAQAKFGDDGRLHTEAQPQLTKNLTAQVRDVVPLARGLYRLTLDNGQVWDTTEADSAVAFKADDAVTISRGLFNSYRIYLTGRMTNVSATRKK